MARCEHETVKVYPAGEFTIRTIASANTKGQDIARPIQIKANFKIPSGLIERETKANRGKLKAIPVIILRMPHTSIEFL